MKDFEDHLRGFRVRDPDPGLRGRILSSLNSLPAEEVPVRPVRLRMWAGSALAAGLAAAVGVSVWLAQSPSDNPNPPRIDKPDVGGPLASTGSVPLFDGRAVLVPVGADTEYTVIDAAAGRVRLSRGEIYLDVPGDEGLRAEIETPAGTAMSPGAQGYVRYAGDEPAKAGPMLTVAVIGGSIEVRNPHGRMTGDAGEVVTAEQHRAPSRQGAAGGPSGHRFGMSHGPGGSWLLHRSEVQSELKLTDEQKSSLHAVAREEWSGMRALFEGMSKVPREERGAKIGEFHAALGKKRTEILTAEQDRRYRQIVLQQEGIMTLTRSSTADSLGLTDEQRRRIEAAVKESNEAIGALFRAGVRNWDDARRKKAEIGRRAADAVSAVLSEDQRRRWKEMQGEPLTLSQSSQSGGPPMFGMPPWGRKDAPRRDEPSRRDDGRRGEGGERREGRN